MYGFWRLGLRPRAVGGSDLRRERARDGDEHEGEERRHEPEHGDDPREEVRARSAGERDRRGREARQHEQPEQERALLAAPEGGDRVRGRQLQARVLGDVDEREVVAQERREQDARGHGRRAERGEKCVLSRARQPPAPGESRVDARDQRVERQPEADDQRRAPELGHQVRFSGVYFDGHFVRRESRFATNTPLWSRPSTRTSRPDLNRSGTDPR